jgi:hypothetical protein
VESEPEKGARFESTYHASTRQRSLWNVRRWRPLVLVGPRRCSLVKDEDAVKGLAFEFVKSVGHAVLTAKHGTEALAIVENLDEPIHLLTDVVMPKLRGPDLAKRHGHPDTDRRPSQ